MLRLIGSAIGLALLMVGCGGGGDGSNAPAPPTITASPLPAGATGTAYPDYFFTVAHGGVSPFVWSETGALPPGLALSPTGQLSGTPVAAGTYAFTVRVADASIPALTATLPVSLKIAAIEISPGQTPPAGAQATPYSYAFVATGGNLPLRWTVTAGTLPPGLTLNADGTLSGTPTAARSTPFAFTVTVADSSTPVPATNSVAYAITINEPPPPSINNTPPPTATAGTPYSFSFTAIGGYAPLVWTPPTAPMGGLTVSLDGVLSGTPSTPGIFPITLTVTDARNQTSPATPFTVRIAMARPEAAFTLTGSMAVAREGHSATLLQNGQVLIAGGSDGTSTLASAELYDPANQAFSATGSMTVVRSAHSATLLGNSKLPNYGKVLVAGGGLSITELFDPTTGTFTATGNMIVARTGQTATLLLDGRVLLAGGYTPNDPALTSAELYDPASGTFTATGSMTVPRKGHTATLLLDGRVLIAGGANSTDPVASSVASAELYDPASGTFTATGSMSEARYGHTAAVLPDGTVLVTGTDSSAEVFSPATGAFSVVGAPLMPGTSATATLRKDGTVLIAGGRIVTFSGTARRPFRAENSSAAAELFAPESGGFVTTGSLITARDGHTATLLVDGTVLVAGGETYSYSCHLGGCSGAAHALSSAELFK